MCDMESKNPFSNKKCVPCEGGVLPYTEKDAYEQLKHFDGWNLSLDSRKIEKNLKFKNFKEALEFINKVGTIAEQEDHHPDINLYGWNKVRITLSTHAIGGLSENDFILAAKIDELGK